MLGHVIGPRPRMGPRIPGHVSRTAHATRRRWTADARVPTGHGHAATGGACLAPARAACEACGDWGETVGPGRRSRETPARRDVI